MTAYRSRDCLKGLLYKERTTGRAGHVYLHFYEPGCFCINGTHMMVAAALLALCMTDSLLYLPMLCTLCVHPSRLLKYCSSTVWWQPAFYSFSLLTCLLVGKIFENCLSLLGELFTVRQNQNNILSLNNGNEERALLSACQWIICLLEWIMMQDAVQLTSP